MRIDALQAAFLSAKLKYLENVISVRRKYAAIYERRLQDLVSVPGDAIGDTSVYHTYVIQCQRRNELKQFLADRGIDTKIHYPTPIHLLEAAGSLGYQRGSFPVVEEQSQRILSLPIAEYLTDKQIEIVADEIERFYS